jgi:hypothetical protein
VSVRLEDLAERLHALPLADQLVVASELLRTGDPGRRRLAKTIIERVGGRLALEELRARR